MSDEILEDSGYSEVETENASFKKKGDMVEGILVDTFEAKYGTGYTIKTGEDKDVVVYDSSTDLDGKMEQLKIGNQVMVQLVDFIDIKDQPQPMKKYTVGQKQPDEFEHLVPEQ